MPDSANANGSRTHAAGGHEAVGGALEGIRVIEFGSLIAGPLCSRILGDFGAEIIKVESPGEGDPLRRWNADLVQGRDLLWTIYARNKKCISIDLRSAAGQEIARQLVANSDVVIENFRPGTLEKWGLGEADLLAINPGLIMARVSGFGQTGPYSHKAGFGSVAEAMGGIRYTTGYPDRPSTRTGVSLGDTSASLFAAIGILIALLHRERSNGQTGLPSRAAGGQVVDVAIYEAVFAMMESLVPDYKLQGKIRQRTGSVLPHVAPSNAYACSDGVEVLIAANADNPFRRLCEAMGRPELATDERFATHTARGENQVEIDEIVARWASGLDSDSVIAAMDEAGVPCGKIYTAREMLSDPQYQARGIIKEMTIDPDLSFPMPAPLPLLSKTPGEVRWPGAMTVGQHTAEVLSGVLGLTGEQIRALAEANVVECDERTSAPA